MDFNFLKIVGGQGRAAALVMVRVPGGGGYCETECGRDEVCDCVQR